jgi:hypothetical protein
MDRTHKTNTPAPGPELSESEVEEGPSRRQRDRVRLTPIYRIGDGITEGTELERLRMRLSAFWSRVAKQRPLTDAQIKPSQVRFSVISVASCSNPNECFRLSAVAAWRKIRFFFSGLGTLSLCARFAVLAISIALGQPGIAAEFGGVALLRYPTNVLNEVLLPQWRLQGNLTWIRSSSPWLTEHGFNQVSVVTFADSPNDGQWGRHLPQDLLALYWHCRTNYPVYLE